ncbi:protein YdiK [Enterobacter asburiae]|uniref:Protein YdiK n=1 Tax=Enterobacter asburiae TaxID=61645 RepID=A0A376F227_ENTAS|nr:protein YdiK [Enterobacter asburiae]
MRFNGLTKGFFIFILALVTWAFFDVLSPYFSAILWAAILTVIFNPVKKQAARRAGGSQRACLAVDHWHYLPDRLYPVDGDPLLARH